MCIATSGPGATNLVTGLADALLDSVPLVAITGQVRIYALHSVCCCVAPLALSLSLSLSLPVCVCVHVPQSPFLT